MTPAPAIDGWTARALRWLRRAFTPDDPKAFRFGVSGGGEAGTRQGYSPLRALSALAANPWVYAAASMRAGCLAGLPLVLVRGRGSAARTIDAHPMLDLLAAPHPRITGEEFRRQALIDLDLAGNCFWLIVPRDRRGTPDSLVRLHPEFVSVVTDPSAGIVGYRYDAVGVSFCYGADDVVHVRLPSWEADDRTWYGTGAIRALHEDLVTDQAVARYSAGRAQTGRPDVLLSPADEKARWTKDQTREIRDNYLRQMGLRPAADTTDEDALGSAHRSVLVVGGPVKVEPVQLNARDEEFAAVRTRAREGLLAALHVPPTLVQLPSANYATAQQEARRFWEALQAVARLFDAAWTRLARRYDAMLFVRHDFAGVESLQESRTERLNRVTTWVLLGAHAADAAAYEGFADAPLVQRADAAPATPSVDATSNADATDTTADVQAVALNGAQVTSAVAIVVAVAAGQLPRPSGVSMLQIFFGLTVEQAEAIMGDVGQGFEPAAAPSDDAVRSTTAGRLQRVAPETQTEAARAARWRSWLSEVHAPIERGMGLVVARYLREAAARFSSRAGRVLGQRAARDAHAREIVLGPTDLDTILAQAEEETALRAKMDPEFVAALARAFELAAAEIDLELAFDPVRRSAIVERLLGEMIANVSADTAEAVRQIVTAGIASGMTTSEVQRAIQDAAAFAPSRALRIARTETTRAVNAGTVQAYRAATDEGVGVRKVWITARDGEVRDAHRALDGQVVDVDAAFRVPTGEHAGATAQMPGDFADAALVVNCRCAVAPRVEEAA